MDQLSVKISAVKTTNVWRYVVAYEGLFEQQNILAEKWSWQFYL